MNEKNKTSKKKEIILISGTLILIIIFSIILKIYISKENEKKIAEQEIKPIAEECLDIKYGSEKITDIKFYKSSKWTHGVGDKSNCMRYVFKYYAKNYPNDEFFITIWIDNKTGRIKDIKEVNIIDDGAGIDDTCASGYTYRDLESKEKQERQERQER